MSDAEAVMKQFGLSADEKVSKEHLKQILARSCRYDDKTSEGIKEIEKEVNTMFQDFDQDGDGGLSYSEIVALTDKSGKLQKCGEIAAKVDKNSDGKITKSEFKNLIDQVPGCKKNVMTDAMLDDFYDRWDKDNNGLSVRECQFGLLRVAIASEKM